ncbi:MAG: xylose isomerase [Spirochaetae bacterium HGW-Spirochaetae-8]|jgi:xylose isomerase|nr:MAG: xylose isomerase [Spirochaetae bacterium HGW-Spirochaetae-8]
MESFYTGDMEYFKGIGKIEFEGPASDNPLAFKFYNPNQIVAGKTMAEHLRFSVAYWHSFCADGTDPFGRATMTFPWKDHDPMQAALNKADAAFEFCTKLGVPFYAFHDTDVAPEGDSAAEYEKNYLTVASYLKKLQDATGVSLLWNTANLFSHPRYMNGAASNPDFAALARAAHQVKTCLDVNVLLGGKGYTFWGGREGYMSLWNTDMKRELDHLGIFFRKARDYGRKIGFEGTFYIEPKPMEPSKHQYDFDASTAIGFIRAQGLENDFKCNIEHNHATLAGHTFAHDLQVCADNGMLGSVDANQGDAQNGWDTDEFPTDVYETTEAMLIILKNGGLHTGGLNFDAKRRRNSTDLADLFIAHIGGMDAFALGLAMADRIIQDGKLDALKAARYRTFDSGEGAEFERGKLTLDQLAEIGRNAVVSDISGRQEMLMNMINQYLFA